MEVGLHLATCCPHQGHLVQDLLAREQTFEEGERGKEKSKMVRKVWRGMVCYITVGMFTQCGLSSTAKTLKSLSGV